MQLAAAAVFHLIPVAAYLIGAGPAGMLAAVLLVALPYIKATKLRLMYAEAQRAGRDAAACQDLLQAAGRWRWLTFLPAARFTEHPGNRSDA